MFNALLISTMKCDKVSQMEFIFATQTFF